jgi:sugar O-acyltransferase (sialic acid O-acetyltransferase NeuD family)
MKIGHQASYDPQASNGCDANRTAASAVRVQNTGQDIRSSDVPRIVVVGCSGHARVVVDILQQNDCEVVGLLDSYKSVANKVLGYQVLGSDDDLPALVTANICNSVIVAIGDNWIRSRMVKRIRELVPGIRFATAIHSSAQIARDASIRQGTVIMPGVVVNTGCDVGEFCILNTRSSLDHDSIMEDFSSLAPGAITGGGVRIGALSAIAIGAVISHGIQIGKNTVIGAGATVVKDIPDRVVAYGTPARIIRDRNPEDSYLGERSRESTTQAPQFVHSSKSMRLIPSNSDEWCAYLGRTRHDFFQTAEFHQIAENFGAGQAWLAVYGNGDKFVAWPYLLQDIEGCELASGREFHDVTSIYGYAGPVACGCEHDGAFLVSAWNAMLETWRSQNVVSAFTRFHPVLGNHRWLPSLRNDTGGFEFTHDTSAEGKTVAIDLLRSEDETWLGYKRQLRQALRRLLSLDMLTIFDPEWRYLDDFVRLYYSTMKRNNAASSYLFPGQYFRQLKDALGSHGSLVVVRHTDQTVAVALLIEYAGLVNVYLLATDDRFVQLSPSKLLIHEAQVWARGRGNSLLHLGGGRGSRTDDSLFRFKASFSDGFYPFYTGRWILDQETYAVLSVDRQKQVERLGFTNTESHFPAYRVPLLVVNARHKQCDGITSDENSEFLTHRSGGSDGRQCFRSSKQHLAVPD